MTVLTRQRRASLALAIALVAAAVPTTDACTIPVFRFALDRWDADAFRLVIPAAWNTRPDLVKLLVPLRGNGEANVRIEESPDPTATDAQLLFPNTDAALWSGKLDAATLAPLLESPARRELVKRILAGDSLVWVVCTGTSDSAEVQRIEKRLRYLEQVATLPTQDPSDADSQPGPGPPLALRFSVLRVALADPAERLFAAMLAGPNHQDWLAKGTSFAAPVFAKGRVLGAWPLAELDDPAIEDASLFLIGRCSCRVKDSNPGWDVLLNIDWQRALAQVGKSANAQAAPSAEAAGPITVTAVPSPTAADRPPTTGSLPWPTIGCVVVAIVSILAGAFLWRVAPIKRHP